MDKFCYNNCNYLTPNEFNQINSKEPHRCLKYKEVVIHGGNHPNILRCDKCLNNNLVIKKIKLISVEKAKKLYPIEITIPAGIVFMNDNDNYLCEPIIDMLGKEVYVVEYRSTICGIIFNVDGFVIYPNMIEHYVLSSKGSR